MYITPVKCINETPICLYKFLRSLSVEVYACVLASLPTTMIASFSFLTASGESIRDLRVLFVVFELLVVVNVHRSITVHSYFPIKSTTTNTSSFHKQL